MKYQDLVTNEIYINVLDVRIPLQFTGKTTERNQYGSVSMIAQFTPVKTGDNRNWYNSIPVITKSFDPDNGNDYIKHS